MPTDTNNRSDNAPPAQAPYNKPSLARVDSSAAEFRHRLWALGIETSGGSHPVDEGLSHMRPFILDGLERVHLRFNPRCEFSINQLASYCYPETTESHISPGSPQAARPIKENDDVADACRYLLWPEDIIQLTKDAGLPLGDLYKLTPKRHQQPNQQPPASQPPGPQPYTDERGALRLPSLGAALYRRVSTLGLGRKRPSNERPTPQRPDFW